MKKKDALEIIRQEIEWCKNNPHTTLEEYREGFIAGLKQALKLIKNSRIYE